MSQSERNRRGLDFKVQDAMQPVSAEVVEILVGNHRKFLSFLEKRVANRSVAEEILQSAFVKALEKGGAIRDGEGAMAWFYRLLRNALIDHYRRQQVEMRSLAQHAVEPVLSPEVDRELENAICACMKGLLPTLKPEYADILHQVDLLEESIGTVAQRQGITANNVMVRLHRARQALKRQLERSCGTCAEHGCLDCSCQQTKVSR